MSDKNLPGFGEEISELVFNGDSDWWVHFGDIGALWRAQPTYIMAQLTFLLGAGINLVHALRNGGRLPYLWLASLLHGLFVEAVTYDMEDIDNFWHSQTPLMFLGRRLPLHIITLYPVFIYHASLAVSKARLPTWAEPFAVGLVVVLIDIPYDIVSVKFLHFTWHDTDPNIADRHYWVPWNSYYFHATFAASFTFWFHASRRWLGGEQKWHASSVWKEAVCCLVSSVMGMPGGVLLFLPLYHPLHDLAAVHSEVTFFILFAIFLVIVWSADRMRKTVTTSNNTIPGHSLGCLIVLHLAVHYAFFLALVVFGSPEREVSIGLHEPTGACHVTVPVATAFGSILSKRKYLCVSDYHEDYFDFGCLPSGPPKDGMSWYSVCGTPFQNRAEYIAIVSTICLLASVVFYNLHFGSHQDVIRANVSAKLKKR